VRPLEAAGFSIDLTDPGSDSGQLWIQRSLGLIQAPNCRGETSAFRRPTLSTNAVFLLFHRAF